MVDLNRGHWDEDLEEARAQLRLTKLGEEKARAAHTEVKLRQEREDRQAAAARKKVQNAKNLDVQSRQKSEEAKRKAEEALRKGFPRHRWEGEIQRWSTEQQRAAVDARRFEDEARRAERDAKALAKDVKVKQEIVTEKFGVTHVLGQKFDYLTKTRATGADAKATLDEATPIYDGTETEVVSVRTVLPPHSILPTVTKALHPDTFRSPKQERDGKRRAFVSGYVVDAHTDHHRACHRSA